MPNLNVGLSLAAITCAANAAYYVEVGCTSIGPSTVCQGENDTITGANGTDNVLYYKCTNSVTATACSNHQGMRLSFTSRPSGNGSASSPYQLANCSFTGQCVCNYRYSYSSSGCSSCNSNPSTQHPFMAVSSSALSGGQGAFHYNASCQYCEDNYFFEMGYCNACPNGGYSDSPTSSKGKTACYLKSGSAFSDEKGSGTCGGAMYWVN
ncbi:MAG: hypothetical protein J6L47_02805 [Alphaproteobacteria bacterium]|nr:hypothetical protein [Alphaproteobacteria bacterium]